MANHEASGTTIVQHSSETWKRDPAPHCPAIYPLPESKRVGRWRDTADGRTRRQISLERGAGVLDVCGRPESSSSSALSPAVSSQFARGDELRLNQLSTLLVMHRCVCPDRKRRSTQHTRTGRPKTWKILSCRWWWRAGGMSLACPLPQPSFQGRGVPLNKNPADANPGDDATTCHSLPVQPHVHRATGRPGLGPWPDPKEGLEDRREPPAGQHMPPPTWPLIQ